MKINEYFENREKLDETLKFFEEKKQLRKTSSQNLVNAHLDKAVHNLEFFEKNKEDIKFNDWLIITLYYALYHCSLTLVANKKYTSKNHTATLLFIIKHYNISKEDANLLEELHINKDDAEFYTNLKNDRHSANYSTNINFSEEKINEYRIKVNSFLQKTKEIVQK
jgi:uncharacterized protein (UPF0332 family)